MREFNKLADEAGFLKWVSEDFSNKIILERPEHYEKFSHTFYLSTAEESLQQTAIV